MIIDAHQHFWQFNPVRDAWITEDMQPIRQDFMPQDLRPVLAANGVDGCVAVQADQSETETDFLLQFQDDFIKGVVGWVDLRADNLEARLEHYKQFPRLKGFRHIVQGEPDKRFLLRPDFMKGVGALQHYDLTYDILIYPHQLPAAAEFVKAFPDHRLVIDHIAKPYIAKQSIEGWEGYMREIASYPQVYCKLSGMVTEADHRHWKAADFRPYLDIVLETFGPERLMYGSDWPVCLLAADYGRVKEIVEDFIAPLSVRERALIMGGNAVEFYKLT